MTSRSTRKSSQRERSAPQEKVHSGSALRASALRLRSPGKSSQRGHEVTRYHDHAWHEPSRQAKARASVHPKAEPGSFVIFVIFVSWGSNLSPAPSAWLDWLLPARLVFVTPVSLRGPALVFSPLRNRGTSALLSFGKETRSPAPSALARSRFPAGDQRRFSSPPGKDLSRQRPLGGNAVTLTLLARSCNPIAPASGSARSSCLAVSALV